MRGRRRARRALRISACITSDTRLACAAPGKFIAQRGHSLALEAETRSDEAGQRDIFAQAGVGEIDAGAERGRGYGPGSPRRAGQLWRASRCIDELSLQANARHLDALAVEDGPPKASRRCSA